jgi:predicted deacylase
MACWRLARAIDARELAGTLVLVPVLNLAAAKNGSRGNPLDLSAFDLNRVYPGKANGWATERLAWAYHEEFSKKADVLLSLHSGGATSYLAPVIYHNELTRSLELAKMFGRGWDLIVEPAYAADRRSTPGTVTAVLGAQGKPALMLEAGGASDSLPERIHRNARLLADGCLNLMRHLGMVTGIAERSDRWKIAREWVVQTATGGFWVPEPETQFQQPMKKGTVLAKIVDVYGDVLEEVKAPCDGQIIGMRTKCAVALPGEVAVYFGEILSEVTE